MEEVDGDLRLAFSKGRELAASIEVAVCTEFSGCKMARAIAAANLAQRSSFFPTYALGSVNVQQLLLDSIDF
jgi:hypothetical protein